VIVNAWPMTNMRRYGVSQSVQSSVGDRKANHSVGVVFSLFFLHSPQDDDDVGSRYQLFTRPTHLSVNGSVQGEVSSRCIVAKLGSL
jgi:hypothetical protein